MKARIPESGSSTAADGGRSLLLQTIQSISRGQFDALDTLYALTGEEGIAPEVAELAESIGLILVKLEAR